MFFLCINVKKIPNKSGYQIYIPKKLGKKGFIIFIVYQSQKSNSRKSMAPKLVIYIALKDGANHIMLIYQKNMKFYDFFPIFKDFTLFFNFWDLARLCTAFFIKTFFRSMKYIYLWFIWTLGQYWANISFLAKIAI